MVQLDFLIEFDRLAKADAKRFSRYRYLFHDIYPLTGKSLLGIVGSRGVGKTVILKQLAIKEEKSFYLSLDTFTDNLFEVVQKLHNEFEIKLFLLDEIHFHPDFHESLKKIYDFLPVKIVFTSSMALALYHSAYDLSRRVVLKKLYPFSFREYLFFKKEIQLPDLSLMHLYNSEIPKECLQYSSFFDLYLSGGIFPFALDDAVVLPVMKNILDTVIMKDISTITHLTMNELNLIKKMLEFVGKSKVDGINYTSLSKNLGITKYKAEQYVSLLEQAFVLHRIMPKGTNVLKEPKILMSVPYRLLYTEIEDALGGLREDFFVEMVMASGYQCYYLKSTRGKKTPDYVLSYKDENIIIEIGGKGKGREQFKGFQADKKMILSHPSKLDALHRPLYLAGMINS